MGHIRVLQVLLKLGASPYRVLENNKWTLLHTAVSYDRKEIVEYILTEKLVDVNARSTVSIVNRI